jgi:hypothetical protein
VPVNVHSLTPNAAGSAKGGYASHANRRREAMAESLIAAVPVTPSHEACDPGNTDSLCDECRAMWTEVQP